MKKTQLNSITTILPFDGDYIKVAKKNDTLWNLMDAEGRLISDVWFHSIERTNDGAIITKGPDNEKKATSRTTEMRFTGIGNFAKFSEVYDFLPSCVVGIINVETVEKYEKDGYVARAMFYGKRVYIKKDGRIFDENGKELHIMFSMVDTDRLNAALLKLNKKLHFDGNYEATGKWSSLIDNKVSIFGFYWFGDDKGDLNVGYDHVFLREIISKWTDKLTIRATLNMPKEVRDTLIKKWGEPDYSHRGEYNENLTWHFDKSKLNFIIDTINAIE